jgi:hypothetical protein
MLYQNDSITRRLDDAVTFWQLNQIVNFLVLSAAVLVLEWTVVSNPNIDHGKHVGYRGY